MKRLWAIMGVAGVARRMSRYPMNRLAVKWATYLDQQHQRPAGWVGLLVGERMRRQHVPETTWSLEALGLQPADRVLEVGFGVGHSLASLVSRTPQGLVVGMDLSPTMIRAAARRNRRALGAGHLVLLRGDVARVPLAERRFEKVLTIHTFYFWPDPYETALHLGALLRPGGRLVATFATATRAASGTYSYWPLQQEAEAVAAELSQHPEFAARLVEGPDSRQFNNVALILERL